MNPIPRSFRFVFFLVFLAIVAMLTSLHARDSIRGSPYESWDEIATYNSAVSIWTSASGRAYSYGGLNTLQQYAANLWDERFDPILRAHPPIRYSNGALASFLDPELGLKEKKWKGMDFAYFRGLSDHLPVFTSRKIHVWIAGILFMVLGGALIFSFPAEGVVAAFVFLFYLTMQEYRTAVESALAGMQTSLLILLALALGARAIENFQNVKSSSILASIVALSAALNMKIDALNYLPGVAACALIFAWRTQNSFQGKVRRLLYFGVFFILSFLLLRPSLLMRGHPEFAPQWATLRGFGGGKVRIEDNLTCFDSLMRQDWSVALPGHAWTWVFLLTLALATGVMIRSKRWSLLVFPASAILGWSVLILHASQIATRYLLYSYLCYLITLGFALGVVCARSRYRDWARGALLVLLISAYGAFALRYHREVHAMESAYAAWGGHDPSQSRTQATEAAIHLIHLIHAGGYSKTILVDQHSYLDLRRFWEEGLTPVFINRFNVESILNLKGSEKRLLVFAPSDPTDPGKGSWSDAQWSAADDAAYRAYVERLSRFPLLKAFGADPVRILDPGPVDPQGRIEIRALPEYE